MWTHFNLRVNTSDNAIWNDVGRSASSGRFVRAWASSEAFRLSRSRCWRSVEPPGSGVDALTAQRPERSQEKCFRFDDESGAEDSVSRRLTRAMISSVPLSRP